MHYKALPTTWARTPLEQPEFLPMSRLEMDVLGWDTLDVLLISGDAYVDHPAFGIPLLGRWLVAHGFRVGICAQPDWNDPESVQGMGRPRLFAGISAGAVDSILAHYTAFRKKRHDDAYTPGGKAGARPNRAAIVYANLTRRAFAGLPLVLGGIEASLRRATHYDFWTDSMRKPVLADAKADLLVYGMGEYALLEAANRLDEACENYGAEGVDLGQVWTGIAGTARLMSLPKGGEGNPLERVQAELGLAEDEMVFLPDHDTIVAQPQKLLDATLQLEQQVHNGMVTAVQGVGDRVLVISPPAPVPDMDFMDSIYAPAFARRAHPAYREPIPAEEMLRTSVTSHRGCGGGCSFCSLALHQGRRIASRSRESILEEVRTIAGAPRFNGSLSDVGGPSANMWQARCRQDKACARSSCMHPKRCPFFEEHQKEAVALLREIRSLPRIKHVRIASGIRYDLAMLDADAVRAYTSEFTGGQLKVAPEHCSEHVLNLMRKPSMALFEEFLELFTRYSESAHKEQYVVPYLLSGFPGCTDADMHELAHWLRARNWSPQQVQCFVPTPGTVATAMFAGGTDARGAALYVARSDAERLRQHRILQPHFGQPHAGQPHGGRSPQKRGERAGNTAGAKGGAASWKRKN